MQCFLIRCVVVGIVSLAALRAQEPARNVGLTGEDVGKAVEYLNAGIKQSKNAKLKKEFKDLLTLLEKPDSKEKVDLRAFPAINPDQPVEGQVGVLQQAVGISTNNVILFDVRIDNIISDNEMMVFVLGNRLKVCAPTKGLIDGQRLNDGLPGSGLLRFRKLL